MFKVPLFADKEVKKPIAARCEADVNTRLRLKYNPYYHTVTKNQGVNIEVDGRPMVMMSSNEYLGLSQHPKVMEAAKKVIDEWGTSACGSRLANGSRSYHTELEEELADFLGKEACHIMTAGYMACMVSISSIAQRGDAVIVDKSIHSSLWDGIRLSFGTIERFSHNDMESLARLLEQLEPDQPKIILVDGVYSMEGHIAPVDELVELANRYQAFLIVDDAHGFGMLGPEGRGVCHHFGKADDVDVIVSSFSKSLASAGGFVAADRSVIDYLRSNSKQIIFSAAPTPPVCATALASLRVMRAEPQHREKLLDNVRYLRGLLDQHGFDYWNSPTAAVPIVIGNRDRCWAVWKSLWESGFFTVMSVSPGVPVGKDLIRCAVSALHTRQQLEQFTEALLKACKRSGVSLKK
ncbi:MAG: aminotransferase class I/II-fold pyridoxal phosphate-dependent enzyme [Candidatus Methylacidiphilales bacterium]